MEALPSTITSPFPKDEAPKLKIDFGQPCETIYVQNLNDRINVKSKLIPVTILSEGKAC